MCVITYVKQTSFTVFDIDEQFILDHRCNGPGCGKVFVIDGNMKNHRDVCFAKEAGYAEYKGLPCKIRTGCPNTPDLKSRFCSKHKPTAVTPRHSQPTDCPGEASQGQSEQQQGIIIG